MLSADLALLTWIAVRQDDKSAGRLLAFCLMLYPVWDLICFYWTGWIDRTNPLKYDPLLYGIDRRMGWDGFAFARLFGSNFWHAAAKLPYEGLRVVLLLWFGLHFRLRTHAQFMAALVAVFGLGAGVLYWILPACGPAYAFAGFPTGLPVVGPHVQKLSGVPNCIPSLHVAAAMLLILFPVGGRGTVLFAWVFLLGTIFATLLGQHYIIDALCALPFALGCEALARREWVKAGAGLAATAVPLVVQRVLS